MVCCEYGNKASSTVLIQTVGDHELPGIENEIDIIRRETGEDFLFLAVKVDDWNKDLSPWKAPAVFGDESFGEGATDTLGYILSEIRDDNRRYYLGGYSLAGLFALWVGCRTDVFSGIAAASPSVWFPGFIDFVKKERFNPDMVYLSLGYREEKTRNPVMATVGNCIRDAADHFRNNGIKTTLEWNEGNHFRDADIRMAKGFIWLVENGRR